MNDDTLSNSITNAKIKGTHYVSFYTNISCKINAIMLGNKVIVLIIISYMTKVDLHLAKIKYC